MFSSSRFKNITCPKQCKSPTCWFSHSSLRINPSKSTLQQFKQPLLKKQKITQSKPPSTPSAPKLSPSLSSKVSTIQRQKSINLFHLQFSRIYNSLGSDLQSSLSATHSLLQEQEIHDRNTVSNSTYVGACVSVLNNLKKREESVGINDTGIDKNYKKPIVIDSSILLELDNLVLKYVELIQLDYPLPPFIDKDIDSSTSCDRCNKRISIPLKKNTELDCVYHPGRITSKISSINGKERNYSCCNSFEGCAIGHHVYSDEDVNILHKKIPFIELNSFKGLKAVGLDCEMSYTTLGFEMTRVTIVDFFTKRVVLDEIVKTFGQVIDANTKFSGVTELDISKGLMFSEIREMILKLISSDTIVIGHGLENDFKVMRIVGRRVIDTVSLWPHFKGLPFRHSLKYLMEKYLGRVVQVGSHDSIEDAVSCIDLVYHRVKGSHSN